MIAKKTILGTKKSKEPEKAGMQRADISEHQCGERGQIIPGFILGTPLSDLTALFHSLANQRRNRGLQNLAGRKYPYNDIIISTEFI